MPESKSDPQTRLLEFIAGLQCLPDESGETERVALAARVGISSDTLGRILDKSDAAAQKALERARKKAR